MKNSETRESSQCVRVAVNIRPLITSELIIGCTDCITVVPGQPQVRIGSHVFTYDYVYGNADSPSTAIYDDCVAPLIDALFHGYNGTVLAYGQMGSGKTYTMGTNYSGEGSNFGIIPKVMESIFRRVETMKESTEFLISVSFIEIFKEEVYDLLAGSNKREGAVSTRAPIQIRETVSGDITLAGVTEPEVKSKEEMASYIARGSLSRATGSTNMNSQSSRSHAIFTITMEQKKISCSQNGAGDDILCAKLHLVELAGSGRAKRTGADAMRFKEGIHINKGLLALGNVISALGDEKKRKEGGHVPYRDSKLTRLLQDSLGGNSKTVMIACVSPADTNMEETLNTLRSANHARNIQNKAVLKKERRNEYEMHKLLALNQRQKMVLQRKTEEASMATKRLKELLESRKASSHETSGAANGNSSNIQAIEHELDVIVRVHEERTEYERRMEEIANEVAKLKEETEMLKQTNLSNCPETMSPGARNSRIFALENMLATSSSTLGSMASQLSEAEDLERVFSGRGHWSQVQSLADAKNIMNHLFNSACSSRCSLRDKEVEVREKETEIRDLKGKVQELIHQLKMQNSTLKRLPTKLEDNDYHDLNCGRKYDLRKRKRKRGNRASIMFLEDMDTSESEHSDTETSDDEWVESRGWSVKKRTKSGSRSSVGFNQSDIDNSENLRLDSSGEGIVAVKQNDKSGLRCICSKFSSCKTRKCQCRDAGVICRTSCRCTASKCSNREAVIIEEDLSQLSMSNTEGRGPGTDETEQDHALASHGATLLQSALSEKPAETNDDCGTRRKPLSDIGKKLAKSNAPKPIQRKKRRNSVIQPVPVALPSSQPQNTEVHKNPENAEVPKKPENSSSDTDIPLKLPRAMCSAASNDANLLRERNVDQAEESFNKEVSVLPSSSTAQPKRTSEERENCSR